MFCVDCYGSPCSRRKGRKKRARRKSSGVLVLLYALRTLPGCSESDRVPRFKPKFNWRRGETKEEREGKVELGEDVKSDEGEKWIVTKESVRSGQRGDEKKETKLKQNKSTVLYSLSLTSVLRRRDYYIIPYICIIYIT